MSHHQRSLKPVFYQLVVGGREFSQIIEVYASPAKEAKIIISGYEFIVMEERQNVDMCQEQLFKSDKAPESIVAIPFPRFVKIDVEAIQKALRSETKKKWIESDISPNNLFSAVKGERPKSAFPFFEMLSGLFVIVSVIGVSWINWPRQWSSAFAILAAVLWFGYVLYKNKK